MKKLLLFLLCGSMLLALSGCDALSFLDDLSSDNPTTPTDNEPISSGTEIESTSSDKEDLAVKYESATPYTNTYLGVTCTMPAGWWLYYVNEDNFTENATLTDDASLLDIYIGSDYSTMYLIEVGNLQYSSKSTHLGIDLSAEKIEDVDNIDDYMVCYEDYLQASYDDTETYELIDSDVVTIGGIDYEMRITEALYEGESSYMLVTFTCEVNNGYFFTVMSSYWPEHTTAVEDTISFIEKAIVIG